jgi:SpoVK/Ycf46/Vps4 family AAA+-type ATPase
MFTVINLLTFIIVQGIFDRARKASPSIIFIDEIDTLIGKRSLDGGGGGKQDVVQERILSMMLNEMDGVSELSNVLTIVSLVRLQIFIMIKRFIRALQIDLIN